MEQISYSDLKNDDFKYILGKSIKHTVAAERSELILIVNRKFNRRIYDLSEIIDDKTYKVWEDSRVSSGYIEYNKLYIFDEYPCEFHKKQYDDGYYKMLFEQMFNDRLDSYIIKYKYLISGTVSEYITIKMIEAAIRVCFDEMTEYFDEFFDESDDVNYAIEGTEDDYFYVREIWKKSVREFINDNCNNLSEIIKNVINE